MSPISHMKIFRQNILVLLAGHIAENVPHNILIGTYLEILRILSEF